MRAHHPKTIRDSPQQRNSAIHFRALPPPPPPTPVRLTVDQAEPIFFLGWITSFQLEIVPTLLLQLISSTLMIGPTHIFKEEFYFTKQHLLP